MAKSYKAMEIIKSEKVEKRFLSHVDKGNHPKGCWLWTAAKNRDGYGKFSNGTKNGKSIWDLAHRVSYSLYNGKIQKGKVIMHSCDNPACVNPDHLTQGTEKENIQDASRKGRLNVHHKIKTATALYIYCHLWFMSNEEVAREYNKNVKLIEDIRDMNNWITKRPDLYNLHKKLLEEGETYLPPQEDRLAS